MNIDNKKSKPNNLNQFEEINAKQKAGYRNKVGDQFDKTKLKTVDLQKFVAAV